MKKNDLFLFLLIIILGIASVAFFRSSSGEGDVVVIRSDGQIYAEVPLSKDDEIIVKNKNMVTIKDKKVFISQADCPDKLCQKQGEISAPGSTIVCLPNRLSVCIRKK